MAKQDVTGTWDEVFGSSSAPVRQIAAALRSLIERLHPQAVMVARPGDRAVSFGHGPRKMSQAYAYLMPQADRVNLGFYQGAVLPDPGALLEGAGKALRHVKIFTQEAAQDPALAILIKAAIIERASALKAS